MRFQSQINLIDLDLKGYLDAVDDEMRRQTIEAARSWLHTVLMIIPTWSRASRATFTELANAVGFSLTFGPQLSRKDRTSLGRMTGRGGLDFKSTSWHFFYETDLRYLAYNEFNRVIFGQAPNVFSRTGLTNPTPYRFQEAGKADFESFAKGVRLPNPMAFIKGRRI